MFTEKQIKERVTSALNDYYESDGSDINAGYNVLRYAQQGLIKTSSRAQAFVEWYPRDPGYVILRLARDGKLAYLSKKVVD